MIVLLCIFTSITAEILLISENVNPIIAVKTEMSSSVISDFYQAIICLIIFRILRIEVKNQ